MCKRAVSGIESSDYAADAIGVMQSMVSQWGNEW